MRFNLKRVGKVLTAAVAAVATLMSGASIAYAGDGGGGHGGSGTAQGGKGMISWVADDNLGAPTVDSVKAAMARVGVNFTNYDGAGERAANNALTAAVNECKARSGNPNANCRLFAVGFVSTPTGAGNNYTGHPAGFWTRDWQGVYDQYVKPYEYAHNGVNYRTNKAFSDGVTSIDSLVAREIGNDAQAQQTAIITIVLNENEPPVNYNLTVTTNQQDGASVKVGSTKPVHDLIHAGNDRGTAENLNATVELHFDGNEWVGAKTVSKGATITSQGDTNSPQFTPSDFGWQIWENGKYWFDVKVAKQGKMANSVDTNDRDAAETWDVAPYTLNIKTDQQKRAAQIAA